MTGSFEPFSSAAAPFLPHSVSTDTDIILDRRHDSALKKSKRNIYLCASGGGSAMWIISGNEQYSSVRRPFRFDIPSISDEGVTLAQLRNSLISIENLLRGQTSYKRRISKVALRCIKVWYSNAKRTCAQNFGRSGGLDSCIKTFNWGACFWIVKVYALVSTEQTAK